MANKKFDAGSAKRLNQAHPLLQKLMNAARDKVEFVILDSQRGRAAQEYAFKKGHSKVHFGNSAHNWSPSVAVDIAPGTNPAKINWNRKGDFIALGKVIVPLAKQMGIRTIALTGADGGAMKPLADVAICVPAKVSNHIQEMHIAVGHLICGYIENTAV